ncbi:MAG TPA: SIS domain-containing protein, partial [Candidatus Omnitrophota bacterium]|nr:SIS domain-containing protein [Candidatus Omnitrophota bacterium]
MKKKIEGIIQESISVKSSLMNAGPQLDNIQKSAESMIKALRSGGKVIVFGNGGSAADSQHIAAE